MSCFRLVLVVVAMVALAGSAAQPPAAAAQPVRVRPGHLFRPTKGPVIASPLVADLDGDGSARDRVGRMGRLLLRHRHRTERQARLAALQPSGLLLVPCRGRPGRRRQMGGRRRLGSGPPLCVARRWHKPARMARESASPDMVGTDASARRARRHPGRGPDVGVRQPRASGAGVAAAGARLGGCDGGLRRSCSRSGDPGRGPASEVPRAARHPRRRRDPCVAAGR